MPPVPSSPPPPPLPPGAMPPAQPPLPPPAAPSDLLRTKIEIFLSDEPGEGGVWRGFTQMSPLTPAESSSSSGSSSMLANPLPSPLFALCALARFGPDLDHHPLSSPARFARLLDRFAVRVQTRGPRPGSPPCRRSARSSATIPRRGRTATSSSNGRSELSRCARTTRFLLFSLEVPLWWLTEVSLGTSGIRCWKRGWW